MKAGKLHKAFVGPSAVIGAIAAILYFPISLVGITLHIVARLCLAISYVLMLRWRMAADIIKYLFI